jgi:hypothetical protein
MEVGEDMVMAAQASPAGEERREEERYRVDWEADIFIPERTTMFRGRVVNLSQSGCYVQTVAWVRVPPTTVVELVFRLDGRWTRVEAEARYAQSRTGVGLRFLGLGQEMRLRLDGVLAELRAAGAAAKVEPETDPEGRDASEEAIDQGLA